MSAVRFLLQAVCILAACRVAGFVMPRLHQPKVVGEMIVGVLLGPSLFGLVAPALHGRLFPAESLRPLALVCQVGIVLYMFVVGTHLQTDFLRQAYRTALSISLAGVITPFVLGSGLASWLYDRGGFFDPALTSWQSMMYFGAAMSVTAFPVLARIIEERGIAGTSVGTLALGAGAADDAIAWCLLAIVLASINSDSSLALYAILGGALYTVVVLTFVRRLMARVKNGRMPLALCLLAAGAWIADTIGIHAVFGAFIMGIAMPRGAFTQTVSRYIEPVAATFLIPLFFAYSGLSTRATLLNSATVWTVAIAVIAVASLGKGVACWIAGRLAGRSNREAMAIGALMNARGLMELIILNIGLQRGLITPTLFTVMVLMTIVTTLLAGPLFGWAWRE